MAGEIFISYRRADEAWARLLHRQLRAEGVEAWYDALVGAGQDWRVATAKALQASQIFVLLFSENAAQSSDIAKELAAAVLEKKLIIPVRLENIAPTGAFLYELASRNWINAYEDTEAKLAELARGLAKLVKEGVKDGSILQYDRIAGGKTKPTWLAPNRLVLAAAAFVVIAAVAGALWTPRKPAPPLANIDVAARIAVLPFDPLSDGPQARHFADALTDEIVTRLNSNRIQVVSRDDASTLRGSDRNRKIAELGVALLFDGTVEDDGKAVKVRVHLDDPVRHATLWSGGVDGPADRSGQLQAQLANTIVSVLACSNRALEPVHGLTDPDLLSRYLHACDIFVQQTYSPQVIYELLASLRAVAAKAPDFTPAHSDLAKFALYFAGLLPPEQAAPLRQEGEAEAHKALALDPKSPDGHLALSLALPATDWAGREKQLRLGVADDPGWPHTNGFLGMMLAETGRLQEAAIFGQRAAAADLQIDWRPFDAYRQCSADQFEPAITYLRDALKITPADPELWNDLRNCLTLARRWSDTLKMVDDASSRPVSVSQESVEEWDVYLTAAKTSRPGDVARARSLALAAPGGANGAITRAISMLSALGLIGDAFATAQRYTPGGPQTGAISMFLFNPLTAPMRRDPQFISLAARLKLVDYWRSSDQWPDFCTDPDLPYNCRTEANKLKAGK
jgi:TolB-like protein